MEFKLPDTISTPQQVQVLRMEAERAHQLLGEASRVSGAVTLPPLSVELSQIAADVPMTAENLQALIAWLSTALQAPVVHIILPALPQPELRQRLTAWLRANVDGNLLVSFQLNSGLAGGFAVRAGATILDFSFRRKLLEGAARMPKVMKALREASPDV
jgi:hypothetical protein